MADIISYIDSTYQQKKKIMFLNLLSAEDTNYIYTIDPDTNYASLIFYLGDNTSVTVPKKIGGATVKYIAPSCYNYNENIEKLKIPNGIIKIE